MLILWGISLICRDASIVDRYWGLGFIILYTLALFEARFLTFRAGFLFCLILLWGLRLSLYIHIRNRKNPEDPRYAKMREFHGKRFWWKSLFTVFFLQGFLQWLLAAPLIFVTLFPQADQWTLFDWVGLLLWSIGFLFEAVADYQMFQFKKNPQMRGKVCRQGLWNLSRHPNYFGEALLWWGYWLISLNTTNGFWTVYSPVLMTVLLLKVSGVSLLEKQLVSTKPEYQKYIEEVPAFIPWKK